MNSATIDRRAGAVSSYSIPIRRDPSEPHGLAVAIAKDGPLDFDSAVAVMTKAVDTWPENVRPYPEEIWKSANVIVRAGGSIGSPEPWPELQPLSSLPPPSIAPTLVGGVLGQMVEAAADAIEVPNELALGVGLAVASGAAARLYRVEMTPGYVEPMNLWCAGVEVSGGRKTSIGTTMAAPVIAWEQAKADSMKGEIAKAKAQSMVLRERIKHLTIRAGKAQDTAEALALAEEIGSLQERVEQEPRIPRRVVQDVTAERVAVMLSENDECLTLLSDEGGPFDGFAGRYNATGTGPNLDVWLQAHAGAAVRVDRNGRPTVMLNRPRLAVAVWMRLSGAWRVLSPEAKTFWNPVRSVVLTEGQ